MEKFAPPEARTNKQKILSQELSIQEGVCQLFSLLPIIYTMISFTFIQETAEIRAGFHEFVQFVNDKSHFTFTYIRRNGFFRLSSS